MLGFARKSTAMSHVASVYTALHLWGLHKSQDHFWTTPWALWEVTDQAGAPPAMELWSSTKNYITCWVLIFGRHWKLPTDHFFLLNTGLLQQRTDKTWQCISKQCLHHHPPHHVWDSKEYGPRPLRHQSCFSMHAGPRCKVCNSISNEMNKTHKGPQPLSL